MSLSTKTADKKLTGRRAAGTTTAATLALAMIFATLLVAISFAVNTSADNSGLSGYAISSNINSDPMYIAVGVRYGADVPFSVGMLSPYGFVVGETEITRSGRYFSPLYKLNCATVYAVCDANLKIGYDSCTEASSESDTDIGGYHVELYSSGNLWSRIDEFESQFGAEYDFCFPAYINGSKTVRVGAFASYTDAGEAAASIADSVSGCQVRIASPSTTGVCVLDDGMESIMFEYEGDENNYLGFSAFQQSGADYAYIQDTATSNVYDGVFCFRHYIDSSCDGLVHINMVELNTYVEGVLPNEIYTSWDLETQKAFAITVRSYSAICVGRHYSSYGFDMCSFSHCQNYRGRRAIIPRVIQAVAETENQVITFGSTIVQGLYSSSIGGWSVNPRYVWGGNVGSYLRSQATPWEKYSEYSSGMSLKEITAAQLKTACREYGETQINSNIVRVDTTTTGDSPYIYTMKMTDSNGHTATVTRCSSIRSLLSGYVRSSNLTIGKGSVDYTYEKVKSTRIIDLSGSGSASVNVKTGSGTGYVNAGKFNFLTAFGKALRDSSSTLHIYTENGVAQVSGGDIDIPVTTEPDENGNYTVVSNYDSFLIVTQLQQIRATHRASSSSSFAIVSKGMGHGVGMSQFGASDLGEAGATAEQILLTYYPGTEISDYFKFKASH